MTISKVQTVGEVPIDVGYTKGMMYLMEVSVSPSEEDLQTVEIRVQAMASAPRVRVVDSSTVIGKQSAYGPDIEHRLGMMTSSDEVVVAVYQQYGAAATLTVQRVPTLEDVYPVGFFDWSGRPVSSDKDLEQLCYTVRNCYVLGLQEDSYGIQ